MSPNVNVKILVVDDDHGHRETLKALLSEWKFTVAGAPDGESAVALVKEASFDLVLMDVRMKGINGIEAMADIKAYNPAIPVLIMTAYSDVQNAVASIKAGAYDYLTKPLDFDELKLTLDRVLDHTATKSENVKLKAALSSSFDFQGVVGQSPSMKKVLEMLASIAPSEATVLITGESGTGKEIVARMVHANSGRRNGPFVAINCAALSENLLESELFGHEKGAFTGAERKRDGRFQAADQGTIFLDEIGEVPLAMQAKLLRAIQEREIQKVGSDEVNKVDVRIVAATNRDLKQDVEDGRFRQDLYYRLYVVSVKLPSLSERQEAIPALATHFLKKFAEKNNKIIKGFTPGVLDRMLKYEWPGNIRELENMVERAVVLLMGEYVSERELPPNLLEGTDSAPHLKTGLANMTLEEIERIVILETLESTGGNKSEAARRLGITRKTLISKIN